MKTKLNIWKIYKNKVVKNWEIIVFLTAKGENVSKKLIFLIDFDITISKKDSTDTLLSV